MTFELLRDFFSMLSLPRVPRGGRSKNGLENWLEKIILRQTFWPEKSPENCPEKKKHVLILDQKNVPGILSGGLPTPFGRPFFPGFFKFFPFFPGLLLRSWCGCYIWMFIASCIPQAQCGVCDELLESILVGASDSWGSKVSDMLVYPKSEPRK